MASSPTPSSWWRGLKFLYVSASALLMVPWILVVLLPLLLSLRPVEASAPSEGTQVLEKALVYLKKDSSYQVGDLVEAQARSGDPATVIVRIIGVVPQEGATAGGGSYLVETERPEVPHEGPRAVMVEEQLHGPLFTLGGWPLQVPLLGPLAPHGPIITYLLMALGLFPLLLQRRDLGGRNP